MGGFSGGNPLMQMGAGVVDAYMGAPLASMAVSGLGQSAQGQDQQAAINQAYERQNQILQTQQDQALKTQQNLLRRAQAEQRARMGLLTGGGGGGSGQAVMDGLQTQMAEKMSNIQYQGDLDKEDLNWQYNTRMQAAKQSSRNQQLGQAGSLFQILNKQPMAASGGDGFGSLP